MARRKTDSPQETALREMTFPENVKVSLNRRSSSCSCQVIFYRLKGMEFYVGTSRAKDILIKRAKKGGYLHGCRLVAF